GAAGGTNATASAGLPGPGLQLRGGAEQRAEDAAEPAPEGDAGAAGSQTAVLELADFPHRQTEEYLPFRAAGSAVAARALVVATASTHARSTTLPFVRPAGCRLKKSLSKRGPLYAFGDRICVLYTRRRKIGVYKRRSGG